MELWLSIQEPKWEPVTDNLLLKEMEGIERDPWVSSKAFGNHQGSGAGIHVLGYGTGEV